MNKQRENRTTYIPRIRLTSEEKLRVMEEYQNTYHPSLAAYVREKLLCTKITSFYKKKIETLQELGQFRTDLVRIGNNINQIAKALNTYKYDTVTKEDRETLLQLLQMLEKIFAILNKIRI